MRSGMGQPSVDMVSHGCPPDDEVSAHWLTERAWESSRQSYGAANATPRRHVVVRIGGRHEEGERPALWDRVGVRRHKATQSLFADIVARSAGGSAAPGAIPSGELDSVGERQHGHRVIVAGTNS